nr:MAG TPA: hypothetical protein [Caudoviricetes sp.]
MLSRCTVNLRKRPACLLCRAGMLTADHSGERMRIA